MGYQQFQNSEEIKNALTEMGLDTTRNFSLQGDGLLNPASAEMTLAVKPTPESAPTAGMN